MSISSFFSGRALLPGAGAAQSVAKDAARWHPPVRDPPAVHRRLPPPGKRPHVPAHLRHKSAKAKGTGRGRGFMPNDVSLSDNEKLINILIKNATPTLLCCGVLKNTPAESNICNLILQIKALVFLLGISISDELIILDDVLSRTLERR